MSHWPRLVMTAFGPFGGEAVNASECLLRDLEARFPTALAPWRERIHLEVLACPEGRGAAERLYGQAEALLGRHGEALYLLTGQAAGRNHLALECFALNRYAGSPIDPRGPAAYSADLPGWESLPRALSQAGLPARPSRDPGEGACNHLHYTLCRLAERRGVALCAGFLHLPITPAQVVAAHPHAPSWPTTLVRSGVVAILRRLVCHLARGEGESGWAGPRVSRMDHWVLPVREMAVSVRFYTRVLGMRVQEDARGHISLHFGIQKINLHPHPGGHLPQAAHPTPGGADLCLLTDQPLPRFIAHLVNEGVVIEDGPVVREGAVGPILSVYFRDPDGNLIEVAKRVEGGATADV